MAYVALSRGRETNHAYIYTRDNTQADHDHADSGVDGGHHQLRRGTKYSAAHHLRKIAANDDRSHTVHVQAQQTDRDQLPDIIRRVLDRNDQRLIARQGAGREQDGAARDYRAAYERMTADLPSAERDR